MKLAFALQVLKQLVDNQIPTKTGTTYLVYPSYPPIVIFLYFILDIISEVTKIYCNALLNPKLLICISEIHQNFF